MSDIETVAVEEAQPSFQPKPSKRHLLYMAILLLMTGFASGSWIGRWCLNWVGSGEIWDITVSDTYTLYLGYPLRKPGDPAYDESQSRYVISPGTQSNNSVEGQVRLVPWLFSSLRYDKGAMEASARESLMHFKGYPTRGGHVRITDSWMAVGPSMSQNSYVPPKLGATFVVDDGANPAGGFTFYELRVDQGRVWSAQALLRYDCAASGVYSTCKETNVSKDLQAGYVGRSTQTLPIPPEPPHKEGSEDYSSDMMPMEPDGTSVTAYAIIRRPDAPDMSGP